MRRIQHFQKKLIFICLFIFFAGCSPFNYGSSISEESPTAIVTPLSTLDPMNSTPSGGREAYLSFDDQTDISILPDSFVPECSMGITQTESIVALPGNLIVYDHERHIPLSWDPAKSQNSLDNIANLEPSEMNALAWNLSPTHEWLSSENDATMDGLFLNAYNPLTGASISVKIADLTEAGYPVSYWADSEHYVVPLVKVGDTYQWLVWQPSSGDQEMLAADLPNIGDAPEESAIFPTYFPNSGYIVYACNQCDQNEYQAFDPENQEVKWTLNFGTGRETGLRWAPIPSPDGKKIIFYFGLNRLWVINTSGESLAKITLPFAKNDNWVVKSLRWSPDGKRLAIIRDTPDGDSPVLTILSLQEGQQITYCSNLGEGSIYWSYDGQYIVHATQVGNDKTETVISIITLATGETFTTSFSRNLSVIGWLKNK